MCDWICDIVFYLQDIILKIWDIFVIAWNWFWTTFEPTKIIAACAGFFTIRAGLSQRGHNFEVMYYVSHCLYHQPQIFEMFIHNKKNRTEVITEINVLIGANCVLELHTFEEPLVLKPYEMKRVKFPPVSIYAINCQPVNMYDIFKEHKYKKVIALTTPYGIIKAKVAKQIPHNTYVSDALHKGAFYIIYHNAYPINNQTLDFKIKYFGHLLINKETKGSFFVYQDGTIKIEHCAKETLKIDIEKLNDINLVKNFIHQAKIYKKKYIVTIYERDKSIEEVYDSLEEKTVPIFSKFQYFFIEPIVRIYQNLRLKRLNSMKKSK